MKFYAFLKDSLRETMDKKSFWVLAILSLLFVALCWSISFKQVSAGETLQNTIKTFNYVQSDDIQNYSYQHFEKLKFKVEDVKEEEKDVWRFTVKAEPAEEFYRAVHREMALRNGLIKDASKAPPGVDEKSAPSTEAQEGYLISRFWDQRFMVKHLKLRETGIFDVALRPADPKKVRGGYEMYLFFGLTDGMALQGSVAEAVYDWQRIFAEWIAGIFGVIIALIFTAFFIPGMLEKGNIEVLLSKPIGRSTLLIYKYLGGLLYVLLLSVILIGGSWLALSVRSGYWNQKYLWSIGIQTFHFAILYSVSVLFGVLWRSWIGSVLMTVLSWIVFTLVNMAHFGVNAPGMASKVPGWAMTLINSLFYVFPKMWYLGKRNELMLAESHVGAEAGTKLTGPQDLQMAILKFIVRDVSWEFIIISSALFAAGMLGLACWRFSRKDY